jgi:DNA-binding response OmpR family regulator
VKQKLLVVEDDCAILTGLIDLLEGEGYSVEKAVDGAEALRLYEQNRPDLVLLDIMIPGKSGYDVCRQIRAKDAATPIIMLTAKSQEVDKVVGLELGADDYIVKPFGIHELLARVHAALRRIHQHDGPMDAAPLSFGDVSVNPKTLTGTKGSTTFEITPREAHLLQLFFQHDGEVLSRFDLLEKVWGVRYEGTTRTLDQHIAKLRQKIEADPANPRHIRTVHGAGYRFSSDPARD